MKFITGLGVMSGTSLDGIDFAICEFQKANYGYSYKIIKTTTINYSENWKKRLINAPNLKAYDFLILHNEYGKYIGQKINAFLDANELNVDFIASHGHTIFHTPEEGLTFQLGNGAFIEAETNIKTICDFRTQDIARGGTGAPLVPIGDDLLFGNYIYYINLGGFSNISYKVENKNIAFDICPVNFVINNLVNSIGFEYDKNGKNGRKGKIDDKLLQELNSIEYYSINPPKSLGREWVGKYFNVILNKYNISIYDKLRTVYEHISIQISNIINSNIKGDVLCTGGGTHNTFLMELLSAKSQSPIVIPDNTIIDYKEALIFALLGLLKMNNEVNCLASVTGAKANHSSGVIYI